MNAIEFLKQYRVYQDETIYNSVGEIVGTLSQLMEEYSAMDGRLVPYEVNDIIHQQNIENHVCDNCGKGKAIICEKCYEIEGRFRECY